METVPKRKTLTFALIGCGRISVKHVRAVIDKLDDLVFVAISDTNPLAPEKLFRDSGYSKKKIENLMLKIHFYTDYREMLEKEKPEITAITTPSGLHFSMAKDALLHGSHLLLEKPMSLSCSEAKDLYMLSKKLGKKIAMGHIYRYFPVVGMIREDVKNHKFGDISHGTVFVRWGHDQAYYDDAAWRGTWDSDGGVLMNQTVHALDLMCWLMDSPAISAVSMLARRHHKMEAEDLGLGIIEFENGALCQIEGTTNTIPSCHEAAFMITGTEGSISLGIKKGRPYFDIRNGKGKKINSSFFKRELKKTSIRNLAHFFNPHIFIYQDLIAAIAENREPIASAYSGYTSVDNILGLYKSAKEARKINLPMEEPFSLENMKDFKL